jgi:hypothetical protein
MILGRMPWNQVAGVAAQGGSCASGVKSACAAPTTNACAAPTTSACAAPVKKT